MMTCAWLWLYVGAFLMLMELLASGFIVFFFGLAAVSVGVLRFVFGEALTETWQVASFTAFLILYLAALRHWCKKTFLGGTAESRTNFDSDYVGRAGKVVEAVEPPLAGRVLVGDSTWDATADAPLAAGTPVRVLGQENVTLRVAPVR